MHLNAPRSQLLRTRSAVRISSKDSSGCVNVAPQRGNGWALCQQLQARKGSKCQQTWREQALKMEPEYLTAAARRYTAARSSIHLRFHHVADINISRPILSACPARELANKWMEGAARRWG